MISNVNYIKSRVLTPWPLPPVMWNAAAFFINILIFSKDIWKNLYTQTVYKYRISVFHILYTANDSEKGTVLRKPNIFKAQFSVLFYFLILNKL